MLYWQSIGRFFATRQGYQATIAINVILSILLLYILGAQIKPYFSQTASLDSQKSENTLSKRSSASYQREINQLAGWNLFGKANITQKAMISSSSLEVLGIFMSDDPEKSSAVIAEKGKDESLYYPGDELPTGQSIKEILDDRVLILNNGALEALLFNMDDFDGNANTTNDWRKQYSSPTNIRRNTRTRSRQSWRQRRSDSDEDSMENMYPNFESLKERLPENLLQRYRSPQGKSPK